VRLQNSCKDLSQEHENQHCVKIQATAGLKGGDTDKEFLVKFNYTSKSRQDERKN